jgi:hypothetical protein
MHIMMQYDFVSSKNFILVHNSDLDYIPHSALNLLSSKYKTI